MEEGASAMSHIDDVRDWHSAFGLPVGTASFDDPEFKMRRARLIAEECAEALAALLGGDIEIDWWPPSDTPIDSARPKRFEPPRLEILAEAGNVFDPQTESAVEFLDGLIDTIWVCLGSAVELGWDANAAWLEVKRSNFSKLGEDGKPILDANGKVRKGELYSPPDLGEFVICAKRG